MDQNPTAGIHRETPSNINLNINNERQDCNIGIVWGVLVAGGVNEGMKVRGYMVDGFHILV
jgi:hypothetical protein